MPFLSAELIRDVIANRPAAGNKGRRFTSTDTNIEYYDDGTTWQAISLASTQLTGNIPESQVTNLVSDLAAKGDATKDGVQKQSYTYGADSGTANAYAVTLSPAPTIAAGSKVVFKSANANTGASTLAVNGGSAVALKKNGSATLVSGDIAAGQIVEAAYDGTNFQIIGGPGTATGSVTSVALTVPSFLSVSGSPVTTSGTLAVSLSGTALPVANGGTGTSSPGIVAGTGISVSGSWPNQTVAASSVKPQWSIGSGVTGTAVGLYVVALLAGAITTGRIVITASDATTDLTFDIKKNGTSIFTSARTITHGALAHAVTDLTSALTSASVSVSAGDYFELDITSGSSSWQFNVGMA